MLLSIVKLVHLAITMFIVFAWLLPFDSVRTVHLILVPLVALHWKTNDGRCFLSTIEQKLGNDPIVENERSPFIKSIIKAMIGSVPSDRVVVCTTYSVMFCSWAISAAIVVVL